MTARKIHASEHDLPRSFLSPSSYRSTSWFHFIILSTSWFHFINFLVSFHQLPGFIHQLPGFISSFYPFYGCLGCHISVLVGWCFIQAQKWWQQSETLSRNSQSWLVSLTVLEIRERAQGKLVIGNMVLAAG